MNNKDFTMKAWVITRSEDGTEWGLTTKENLIKSPFLTKDDIGNENEMLEFIATPEIARKLYLYAKLSGTIRA